MLNNKTFLAVVLARGGSKRLPKKNILYLNAKPLMSYTLEAGLKSKYIDRLILSSDNDEILQVGQDLGAKTLKRPKELATDKATSFDALKHVLQTQNEYDYVLLLQATSPLRDQTHIDEAIELLVQKGADAVISVCETQHSPLFSNTLTEDANMNGFLKEDLQHKRAQDLDIYYRLNGAIYICATQKFLSEETLFLKDKCFAYKMPKRVSVDIDDDIDFKLAEILLKDIQNNG